MHGCSNIAYLNTGVSLHSSPVLKETARYFGGDFAICAKHFKCFALGVQCTVLCKSNANEFWRNSWLFVALRRNFTWNDISTKFPRIFVTPIVLIRATFRMIIRFARWFIPNFHVIIRSSRKVAAIFRMIIHSSRKFDLLFINRLRALFFET